jgi:hypothetical protein
MPKDDIDYMDQTLYAEVTSPPDNKETITEIKAFTLKKYTSKLKEITIILNLLIKHRMIAPDTELTDFRKIFNNETPSKPIMWTGCMSELYYFIKLLHNNFNLINDLNANIWKITSKLFVDAFGNSFDWRKFRSQKNPSKADIIEQIVRFLQ